MFAGIEPPIALALQGHKMLKPHIIILVVCRAATSVRKLGPEPYIPSPNLEPSEQRICDKFRAKTSVPKFSMEGVMGRSLEHHALPTLQNALSVYSDECKGSWRKSGP